ncbi:MAG: hypothetical protein M1821_006573 [Bathelium mastoideum]|nr:MAG: hypothetical protein M1821_006573 [Bathelium mastoideum]
MPKIDVHHHFYSPGFTQAIKDAGGDPSGWLVPEWTLEEDQHLCGRMGIETAMLSAPAPGPEIKGDPAGSAELAREINDFSARIRDGDPARYGMFASVPSPLDTQRCLAEIRRAFDELHADGVILMTRYGDDNHYLGHPDIQPVWQELNRRKAVVLVHPTHPVDTHAVNARLPLPIFDYPHETGRTAVDLILSNTLLDVAQDCKIILSHAGGTLPMLLARVEGLMSFTGFGEKCIREVRGEEAGFFYYDTALASSDEQLAALTRIAKPGHIFFGSDFPNAPVGSVKHFTDMLEGSEVVDEETLEDIKYRSALELFPRLRTHCVKLETIV